MSAITEPTLSPQANSAKNGNGRRKRVVLIMLAVFGFIGLCFSVYWWFIGQYTTSTDDAYVMGNLVTVAPQITATVVAINADETDLVQQGQVLVQLDDTNTSIALDQAKAHLADTVRQVRQKYERVEQLRQQVASRQSDVANAKEDLTRRQALARNNIVTTEEVQHSQTAYTSGSAGLSALKHDLQAARALVQGTDIEHHPLVLAAEAQLRAAYVEWQRHRVLAPVTGYVAKRSVQLGQRVAIGTPLMTIVPLQQLWVDANFKEDQFADIRIGQPVTMSADLYGKGTLFHGKVVGLGAGTGASFALLPPQNASGNWIKIVQRVPVRISLDATELQARPLRVGLSMQVTVDTHQRDGNVLASAPFNGTRYRTSVYAEDATAASAMINTIVSENLTNTHVVTAQH